MTHPGGRPRKWKSVAEMQKAIDAYFAGTPPGERTITGLALAVGLTSRQALLNYEGRPEFVDAIKRAKLRVENDYERSLRDKGRAGDIFGLKNFGWRDEQHIQQDTKQEIVVRYDDGDRNAETPSP